MFRIVLLLIVSFYGVSAECDVPTSIKSAVWYAGYASITPDVDLWLYYNFSNEVVELIVNNGTTSHNLAAIDCLSSWNDGSSTYFILHQDQDTPPACVRFEVFTDSATGAGAMLINQVFMENKTITGNNASDCPKLISDKCPDDVHKCASMWFPRSTEVNSPVFTPSACPYPGNYHLSVQHSSGIECAQNAESKAIIAGSNITLNACNSFAGNATYKDVSILNQNLTCLATLGSKDANTTEVGNESNSMLLLLAEDGLTLYCCRFNQRDGVLRMSLDVTNKFDATCANGTYTTTGRDNVEDDILNFLYVELSTVSPSAPPI